MCGRRIPAVPIAASSAPSLRGSSLITSYPFTLVALTLMKTARCFAQAQTVVTRRRLPLTLDTVRREPSASMAGQWGDSGDTHTLVGAEKETTPGSLRSLIRRILLISHASNRGGVGQVFITEHSGNHVRIHVEIKFPYQSSESNRGIKWLEKKEEAEARAQVQVESPLSQ